MIRNIRHQVDMLVNDEINERIQTNCIILQVYKSLQGVFFVIYFNKCNTIINSIGYLFSWIFNNHKKKITSTYLYYVFQINIIILQLLAKKIYVLFAILSNDPTLLDV